MRVQQLGAVLLLTSMVSAGRLSGRYALPIPLDNNGNEIARLEIRQDTSDPGVAQTADPEPTADPAPSPSESQDPPPPQTTDDDDPEPTSEPSLPPTLPPTNIPSETTPVPTPTPSADPGDDDDDDDDDEEESSSSSSRRTTTTPPTSSSTSKKAEPTTQYSASETTIIVTRTLDNGDLETGTSVQTSLIPTNTVAPINSEPDTSGGMSSKTKATVIGVTCGVGGAIVLAVGFFFFWKWHSRRKQRAAIDDGDELVGMNAMGGIGEKGSGDGGDKFKSTLESYHAAPTGRANPSANF